MSVKINKEEHSESEQKPLLDASPSSATFTHEKLTGYVMFSVAWAVISSFQFGWNIGGIFSIYAYKDQTYLLSRSH
jgi:hypothetical protein